MYERFARRRDVRRARGGWAKTRPVSLCAPWVLIAPKRGRSRPRTVEQCAPPREAAGIFLVLLVDQHEIFEHVPWREEAGLRAPAQELLPEVHQASLIQRRVVETMKS